MTINIFKLPLIQGERNSKLEISIRYKILHLKLKTTLILIQFLYKFITYFEQRILILLNCPRILFSFCSYYVELVFDKILFDII